jgi:hypothetical protein
MPQDVTNFPHGRPRAQEIGRQRVPEDMGPLTGEDKASTLQRAPDNRTDRDRVRKATLGGLHAEEYAAGRTARSHLGKIGHQSLANVLGQGETVAPSPFATDEQRAVVPIDIIQRHGNDFTRSQAETRHQEHNGVIALAGGMVLIATL